MKAWRMLWLLVLTMPLAGCELVGDIFEAGVWVGVIAVVIAVAVIGFIVTKIRGA